MYNFTQWTAFSQCINIYIYLFFYRNKNIIPLKTQNIVSEIHAATVQIQEETCRCKCAKP